MHGAQAVLRARVYFPLTFLVCLLLYFLTPYLPALGDGILFGAAGVLGCALLVLVRAVALLQRSTISNVWLASSALMAALGVCGVHTSLYYGMPTSMMTEHTVLMERAEHVLLVEQWHDAVGADRILAAVPKHCWLLKTFSLNGLLLVVAIALGVLLGRQVEKASHLWAIAILSAVMDMWSVAAGVTARIVASPSTAYAFLLNWPLAGQGGVTYPLIGATDILFVVLFLFLVHKFQLALIRNTIGIGVALAIAVLSAVLLQHGVPALPCLGVSVLMTNFRAVRPERKELLQIVVGAGVSLGIFAMLWGHL